MAPTPFTTSLAPVVRSKLESTYAPRIARELDDQELMAVCLFLDAVLIARPTPASLYAMSAYVLDQKS
ncbi:MAG: hypothetical protein J2P22_14770 [Nocardioides sp.]|nr:hypothetical protein [Nocardioides sp.]